MDDAMKALKLRGDGAWAMLQALSADYEVLIAQMQKSKAYLDRAIEAGEEFDRANGIAIGDKADPKTEMLRVIREQMPHLKDMTDEDLLRTLNKDGG